MSLRLIPLLALVLTACPGTVEVALDTSGVTDATYGVDYAASLSLGDYSGTAAFSVNSGSLPRGLSLDAAGRISGTPEWVETTTAEVLVSGLDGADDFVGSVTVAVNTEGLDAALGFEHDFLNNFYDDFSPGRMPNIWMRLEGTGVADQSQWTMNPGVYLPGPNGVHEDGIDRGHTDGSGDDVRIGDLDFRALEWDFHTWRPTIQPNAFPQNGYPSVHLPEGDSPTFTGRGVFSAGVDGGQAILEITHPAYPNTVEKRVQIVPPDWCPNGQSDGPQIGVCE